MADYDLSFSSVSIPANSGGISVTVEEDDNSDGTTDTTETIALSDGVTDYTTTSGAFAGSGQVALSFDLGPPSDETVTAESLFPVETLGPSPIQVTTNLPDEDQPVLGNGVEDEIQVDRETAPSNYGDVRYQIRETGESTWDSNATGFSEFIGNYDTITFAFVGREDGEEYEVRARTETEHVTGAWTSPVTITTKFPGASNLAVDSISETTASLSWTDNADNEDGFYVDRKKRVGGTWSDWQALAGLAPNTTTYTDDTLQPNRTYLYRIRSYTEHTEASSSEIETTTSTTPVRQTRVPSDGWYVEIDHPDGQTLTPRLLDDPEWAPTVNGLPEIRIPVPRDKRWLSDTLEGQPMRVWQDGRRYEIDEFVDAEIGTDRVTLIGQGGTGAETHVDVEYDSRAAHLAMRDLVSNNTSYATNVDAPDANPEEVQVQMADTQTEFDAELKRAPNNDDAWATENGTVRGRQAAYTTEAENYDNSEGGTDVQSLTNSNASAGTFTIVAGNSTGAVEYNFTPEYTIAASDFNVYIRHSLRTLSGDAYAAYYVILDGEQLAEIDVTTLTDEWVWNNIKDDDVSLGGYSPPSSDVEAGTAHTLRLERVGTSNESHGWDVVAPVDDSWSFTLDNSISNGARVSGPELYPDGVDVRFEREASARAVVGARIDATVDDTSGAFALAASNDFGKTFKTASNDPTPSFSFDSYGGSVEMRATLGRYGTRTGTTPTTGFKPQTLDAITLYADTEDTPVLVNQTYEGQLSDVLAEIADFGNFVTEFRRIDDTTTTFEATQPGQRSTDVEPAIADYQTTKRTSEVYTRAIIKGSARPATNQVTANHGTAVDLSGARLQSGSVSVYDPSTRIQYDEDVDFAIDYGAGTITTLATGDIADGQTLAVDYRRVPRGESQTDTHDPASDRTLTRTLPNVSSDREARQVARILVDDLKDPTWSANVTLSRVDAGLSLLDDMGAIDRLPGDGTRVAKSLTQSPEQVVVELGDRQGLEGLLSSLNQRLAATERQV